MRGEFDAKKLAAMEAIRGIIYTDLNGSHNVNGRQAPLVQSAWDNLFNDIATKILIQGTLKDQYQNASYNFSTDAIDWNGHSPIDAVKLGDVNNNDITNGSTSKDLIIGSKGDDVLSGGYGDDTYVFNLGDGKDTIGEKYDNGYGTPYSNESYGTDKIVLGAGIVKEDIYFSRSGLELTIHFRNSLEDSIRIAYQYGYISNRIETLQFADGTTLDISDSNNLTFEYYGTNGDDGIGANGGAHNIINAGDGNDIIHIVGTGGESIANGGKGDDNITSFYGSDDTYVYNLGDGKDTIDDGSSSNDKIIFGAGIAKEDIYFTKSAYDLMINFRNHQS